MESDSISNASVASSYPRDIGAKKKRANRSAKLKQCKLDARREQWLSHVKNKGECKEINGGASMHLENQISKGIGKLEINTRSEEGIYGDGPSMHNCSDSESVPSNSPTSHSSSVSGSNGSGANFTASSSSSSSSSGANCFCLGHMSEEDDCLDDWEAVADALAANDDKQEEHTTNIVPPLKKHEHSAEFSIPSVDRNHMASANSGSGRTANHMVKCCAWRPDDASRPQSLPNLSRQYSFPSKSERHFGQGSVWGCQSVGSIPTLCPICCEDLDNTDSSFLPCACGFTLCLFCYKRILEENGRCPGCRNKYEVELNEGEAIRSLTF